jgi:uncharacterized protein DUF3237
MPRPTRSWNKPLPSDRPTMAAVIPCAVRTVVPSLATFTQEAGSGRLSTPVARLGSAFGAEGRSGIVREVLVSLARAPVGSRVFLESQPEAGPVERIQAFALPTSGASGSREFRAVLPKQPSKAQQIYVPVAIANGEQTRGESIRAEYPEMPPVTSARDVPQAGARRAPVTPAETPLPAPTMTLLAHVDAELPNATVFGATPEGLRIAFYIADGHWRGPRIHARYKPEGGDWLLVRKDGIAIPDVRATLETSDGALLYYELSGKIDLGATGYERSLAGELPEVTPFSAVARVSTSSEAWKWMNRLTLVGVGLVNLKIRRARYDLYSLQCEPQAVREH